MLYRLFPNLETGKGREMKARFFASILAAGLWISGAHATDVTAADAEEAVKGWVNLREALGEQISAEPESVLEYTANGGTGT